MGVRRVILDIQSDAIEASRDFYALLGLRQVVDRGWVVTLTAPENPEAQVTLIGRDANAQAQPDVSIEVDDVDAVYRAVLADGAEIIWPIQEDESGVRRFLVRDPNGMVVNVLSATAAGTPPPAPAEPPHLGPPSA
ncbi:VOC family protein [Rhizomonospora bruguierae]|uniref:VOC family protein n=1 Tax=Rhizomonospora bruguierae TaxID=1581705 RepID=UPI001BD12FB7|nr:VOC family protein [Micromonospora sp. NBRC 107566]